MTQIAAVNETYKFTSVTDKGWTTFIFLVGGGWGGGVGGEERVENFLSKIVPFSTSVIRLCIFFFFATLIFLVHDLFSKKMF